MTQSLPLSTEQEMALFQAACHVQRNSYAPYSSFHVGAALLTDDGEIFAGCNVENASYGLTICAERAAVMQAVSAGKRHFVALALCATKSVPPCGACLQVLSEFMDRLAPIYILDQAGICTQSSTLGTLFPQAFTLHD